MAELIGGEGDRQAGFVEQCRYGAAKRMWRRPLGDLGLAGGAEVTEAQMRNLFGEGRHPDAERLENAALDAGKSVTQAKRASQLGRVFAIYRGNQPDFLQETARRYTPATTWPTASTGGLRFRPSAAVCPEISEP